MHTVGTNIRRVISRRHLEGRDAQPISASAISEGTGIHTSNLSQYLSGKTKPKVDNLKKIADFLEVSLDELMEGVE